MKRAKVAGFAFEDNLSPSQEETSNSRSSLHCFYPPFLDNSSWAVVRRAFRNHLRLDEKRAEETLYDEERPVLELRTREPESFHVLPEDRRIYPDSARATYKVFPEWLWILTAFQASVCS
uniref:Uncharacterized protein n=1 Tax=Tetraselmis sp. GSL018 TaxID=582737 RepID=A0A061RM15_9CHLO